jgi:hypothetical protein
VSEWTITLTYPDVDRGTRESWEDRMAAFDAFAASVPGVQSTLSLHAAGSDLGGVISETLQAALAATNLEPLAVDVASDAVLRRRAEAPTLPRLVSAPEVGEILGGISRQRVYQLQHHAAFPEPLFRLRTGPVWDQRAIEAFEAGWARQPGRPARAAAAEVRMRPNKKTPAKKAVTKKVLTKKTP